MSLSPRRASLRLTVTASLRFHQLNKAYIGSRVVEARSYSLRVVLCHVDLPSGEDAAVPTREVRPVNLGANRLSADFGRSCRNFVSVST